MRVPGMNWPPPLRVWLPLALLFSSLLVGATAMVAAVHLEALQTALLVAALVLVLNTLLWLGLWRQVQQPLRQLVAELRGGERVDGPLPGLDRGGEVAELARLLAQTTAAYVVHQQCLSASFARSAQFGSLLSADGKLLDANDHALEVAGVAREAVIGRDFWDTPWWADDADAQAQLRLDIASAAAGEQIQRIVSYPAVGGGRRRARFSLRPLQDRSGQVKWLLAEGQDITQMLEAEERSQRLSAFYAMLSRSNTLIARAETEELLLDGICQAVVELEEIGGAWVGCLDAAGQLRPLAAAGIDSEHLEPLSQSLGAALSDGTGSLGGALQRCEHQVSNGFAEEPDARGEHSWERSVRSAGFFAAACFPIFRNGEMAGALSLYAGRSGMFSGELVALLDKLAEDVSYGLDALARQQQLHLAATVVDSTRESIIVTDAERRVVSVNRAFTAITGFAADEVIGRDLALTELGQQDNGYYNTMWQLVESNGHWQGELWSRRKSGEPFPALFSIAQVKDPQGRVANYVCVAADITEHREAEARVRHLAYNDALTNLPNRMLLCDRAGQAFNNAERHDQSVALMYLDLDHFKHVNESLGHSTGDALLKEVAKRLSSILRESDTIGRMGGDEFLIVLPDTDANEAAHIAHDLLDQFGFPFKISGQTLSITASVGIAMFPQDGVGFDALHKHADVAMYKAKEIGRNRYHFFTAELNTAATERLVLENALRHAVANDELSLHYQPQLEVSSGELVGAEALLRWTHPRLGPIAPDQFIPIAEDTGLIGDIGAWVLREACSQVKQWQDMGLPPLTVAVNVSVKQFAMSNMFELVASALSHSRLAPELLEIEITESVLALDVERTLATLNDIHALGVGIAVDDFGTGYSSLSYLKRFPLDKLKIDQSFINDIVSDKDDREIAAGIINLGHALELAVMAEGVESEAQLALLRELGCDTVQGYLLSRPLPGDDATAYLKKQAARGRRRLARSDSEM